jgi:hypothetical protein
MIQPLGIIATSFAICLLATGSGRGAEEIGKPAAAVWKPTGDTSVVYRYDPISQKHSPVAPKDLKRNCVYLRFSQRLGRWVWSKAGSDGTLRFAFGPGSAQPAALFDMPAATEERRRALEKQSPELAKRLAINGAKPSLRLGEDGRWSLMPDSTKGRVFDMETGMRWEWHGSQVVPVTHGSGTNLWTYSAGRHHPAGGQRWWSIPPSYQW